MWTLAEHSLLQITGVFRVRCPAPPDRPLRRQHGTHTVDRIRPSFHNPIFSPPLPIVSLHSVNLLYRIRLYQLWCFRISAWLVSAPRMEWLIRLSRGRFLSRLATTCENRGKCKFVFFFTFLNNNWWHGRSVNHLYALSNWVETALSCLHYSTTAACFLSVNKKYLGGR